jgi:hypothetical protein
MVKFDIRRVRKLEPAERYSELYYHWSRAEQMIASNFPGGQRYGRRLKRRIENLYCEWFGAGTQPNCRISSPRLLEA